MIYFEISMIPSSDLVTRWWISVKLFWIFITEKKNLNKKNFFFWKCRKSCCFCGRIFAWFLRSWKVYEVFHVCFIISSLWDINGGPVSIRWYFAIWKWVFSDFGGLPKLNRGTKSAKFFVATVTDKLEFTYHWPVIKSNRYY